MIADAPAHQHNWFRMCLLGYLFGFSVLFMNVLNSALTSSMTIKSDEDFVNSPGDVLRFPRVHIYAEERSHVSGLFTVISSNVCREQVSDYYIISIHQ